MGVEHLNPKGVHRNPAFTQAVVVSGAHRTVYVGGQNAVDASGTIVGKGDLAAQAEQAFRNLETVLGGAGAFLEDVVKWSIHFVHGHSPHPAFEVFLRVWGDRGPPPAITVAAVPALANPDFLIEIDAVAVLPA